MKNLGWVLLLYMVIINLWGIVLCASDKHRAKSGKWRIPEANFFLLAVFGGGLGVLLGMYSFRHKTKHLSFVWGIPLITLVMYSGFSWILLRML